VVVVETGRRSIVVVGDVAVWFGELDEPHTQGPLLVRALDPELVWLAHEQEPWRRSPLRAMGASRRSPLGATGFSEGAERFRRVPRPARR